MARAKRRSKPQKINYVKEVTKLFKDFFRRDFIKDEVLKQPEELKKLYKKINIATFIMNGIIFNLFSFLTLAGNYMIEKGIGTIGIGLYLLYFGSNIIHTLYDQWDKNLSTEIKFHREDSLTATAHRILSKVTNQVYQKSNNKWYQCSPEQVTNCICDYLANYWDIQNNYLINFGQIFSTVVILIITVLTNKTIPQTHFIPLIIVTSYIKLLCCAYDRYHHARFVRETNPLADQKSTIKNDVLRVIPIVGKDQEFRIAKYQTLAYKHFSKKKDLIQKDFSSDLFSSIAHILSSYALILMYINGSNEITLATIAGMTAELVVFNRAVDSFGQITRIFTSRSQSWDGIEKREELLKEILSVYHTENNKEKVSISSLSIPSFEIMYNETSENDRPFKLSLKESLHYEKGDCIALTGASGSGKSTFLKVTTNRIKFQHNTEITPVNYMYYDETIDFGSLPLFEELFCLSVETQPNPKELQKMEYILKQMQLYYEISENCKDFWTWMKENTASKLSRGQKQRLIVSKLLFWLNPDIDIIALDECTSGLDAETAEDSNNADAQKILQFIIDYCNRDKKRVIFLATHQNIDALCNHKLHFVRNNGHTTIQKLF